MAPVRPLRELTRGTPGDPVLPVHVLHDHAHAEFWPCLDRGEKAISSQIARKWAISAQAAIGLRHVMTWRTYMYIIIIKYQLK